MKLYKWKLLLPILCLLVLITACGNPLSKLLGEKDTDVSIIVNHNAVEEIDGMRQTVMYYQDENGLVIPVMKNIPWEEGIAKSALRHLIDDPEKVGNDEEGLLPTLPYGTEVLGMSINDGLCKVDFNSNVLSYNTEAEEKAMITSIVYTLTEFPAIDRVQIMVEGEIYDTFRFGTEVALPLERENINLVGSLQEDTLPVVVYYKATTNGENSYYIPVTKGISALKADIKSALVALLEGAPSETGLFSEIPVGTAVNDVYVRDGIAYIDLTEEILKMPENEALQQSMVYEIGLTLREIEPTITQVRILNNGKEIELGSNVELNLPVFSNVK
ncbi:GerMN domain-containing protein [Alkaliphilus serpentinus]|uniref:GerMN domain-containing protein n=1 Tax=Alkaliphilus serpentinus TaxID=1482731 RepID=A0A833M7B0_9FIRM|nr:GerMN domain-containing protein [Alkaliphilus serpentinus]KAB3530027.1 GerMN domain-containing protein [Alkaliphilus serpentinus]